MVRENSGFWDSIEAMPGSSADERTYDANDIATPFRYLVTNGVQTGGAYLRVAPGEFNYSVQVPAGMAWINGRWYVLWSDGADEVVVKTLLHDAPIQYSRIDRIVLRYDANYTLAGRYIKLVVLKGVESAAPVAPDLTRTAEIYEISLAQVTVKPGQSVILSEDVSDERFDGDVCGIAEFAPEPNLQPKVDDFLVQMQAYYATAQAEANDLYNGFDAQLNALLADLAQHGVISTLVNTAPPSGQAGWTDAQKYLDGLMNLKYNKPLRFTNTSVSTSGWNADSTYTDYPYRKAVTLAGVTAAMVPDVVLAPTDATGGNIAPIAQSYAGGIYLYAKEVPSAAFTIPTVTLWQGV